MSVLAIAVLTYFTCMKNFESQQQTITIQQSEAKMIVLSGRLLRLKEVFSFLYDRKLVFNDQ